MTVKTFGCLLTLCLSFCSGAYAQKSAGTAWSKNGNKMDVSGPDDANMQLAKRIVRSASVKAGNVVIIEGGKQMIPLMEDIAIEVAMAGGLPNIFYDSDRVARAAFKDVPDKYLDQEPRYFADWLKHTDVYISLPGIEDPKALIADVPAERFAKIGKANHFFGDLMNSLPVRWVDVGYPTKADADIAGMELTDYQRLVFAGINTDYETLSARGKKIQNLLRTAKQVRISTPAGTDISFSMASGRGVFLDDGIVTEQEANAKTFTERFVALPGGSVYFAPLETSANGRVVVPKETCRYQPRDRATFELKSGKMFNFKAGTNQACFDEAWKTGTGQFYVFGKVWIGLNPGMHVVEDDKANFRATNIAGLVSIGFGDNRQYGGSLDSVGGAGFALTNATVTVDGKTIVKDGQLVD